MVVTGASIHRHLQTNQHESKSAHHPGGCKVMLSSHKGAILRAPGGRNNWKGEVTEQGLITLIRSGIAEQGSTRRSPGRDQPIAPKKKGEERLLCFLGCHQKCRMGRRFHGVLYEDRPCSTKKGEEMDCP